MTYRDTGKRVFDIAAAIVAFAVSLPVMVVAAGAVWLMLGRPVVFRQQRSGMKGRPFILFKFRTMTGDRDVNGRLLPDEDRLHPLGRLLRSTSVDELPTLINVLRGEMSMVGPRPLFTFYDDRYNAFQRRRLEEKPGITGWAQIQGRNALSWNEKFKMDVWYVDHVSFRLDLKILWLTIWKVIKREGVSQPGQATVEYFQGNQPVSHENANER